MYLQVTKPRPIRVVVEVDALEQVGDVRLAHGLLEVDVGGKELQEGDRLLDVPARELVDLDDLHLGHGRRVLSLRCPTLKW